MILVIVVVVVALWNVLTIGVWDCGNHFRHGCGGCRCRILHVRIRTSRRRRRRRYMMNT